MYKGVKHHLLSHNSLHFTIAAEISLIYTIHVYELSVIAYSTWWFLHLHR